MIELMLACFKDSQAVHTALRDARETDRLETVISEGVGEITIMPVNARPDERNTVLEGYLGERGVEYAQIRESYSVENPGQLTVRTLREITTHPEIDKVYMTAQRLLNPTL